MADKTTLEQMLEHLVNGETDKADELFHEYVVAKSREIYEGLIESEIEDEQTEESAESDDEAVEEDFEDLEVAEADDEDDMGDDEGDPTDSLMKDLEGGDDDEGDMDEPATKQDVADGFDELMAKFDELASEVGGHSEPDGDEMGGMPDMDMKDAFEPEMATVREYVEKVPAGHGAEKKGSAEAAGANTKVPLAGKNDMGGTTANIVSGRDGADVSFAGAGGTVKGSSLINQKPQPMNTGNINVPGGKAGGAFNKKEPGHGAEKKGAGEQGGTNAASLFRNK